MTNSSLPKTLLLTALAGLFFLVSSWGAFTSLQSGVMGMVSSFASPIKEAIKNVESVFSFFSHLQTIEGDNASLRLRVAELEEQVADIEMLRAENAALQKQIGVLPPSTSEKFFVPIVRYEYVPAVGYLYAYIGNLQVNPGEWVVSYSYIVGQIDEVIGTYAKVRLITASDTNIPVQIGSSGILGYLQGQAGSDVVVSNVDAQAEVPLYSEVKPWQPNSLEVEKYTFGRVLEILSTEADANKELVLELSLDLYKLDYLVILPGNV